MDQRNLFEELRKATDVALNEYVEKSTGAKKETLRDVTYMFQRGTYYVMNEILIPHVNDEIRKTQNKMMKNFKIAVGGIISIITLILELVKYMI